MTIKLNDFVKAKYLGQEITGVVVCLFRTSDCLVVFDDQSIPGSKILNAGDCTIYIRNAAYIPVSHIELYLDKNAAWFSWRSVSKIDKTVEESNSTDKLLSNVFSNKEKTDIEHIKQGRWLSGIDKYSEKNCTRPEGSPWKWL